MNQKERFRDTCARKFPFSSMISLIVCVHSDNTLSGKRSTLCSGRLTSARRPLPSPTQSDLMQGFTLPRISLPNLSGNHSILGRAFMQSQFSKFCSWRCFTDWKALRRFLNERSYLVPENRTLLSQVWAWSRNLCPENLQHFSKLRSQICSHTVTTN